MERKQNHQNEKKQRIFSIYAVKHRHFECVCIVSSLTKLGKSRGTGRRMRCKKVIKIAIN